MILKMIANLDGKVRYDTMEGKTYLVAPMVMMTEGVHEGSGGPLYYPVEELSLCPQAWNCKPVVVYHPTRNGQSVSACDPIVLSNRRIGTIMNAHVGDVSIDKKTTLKALKAEAWLEEDRIKNVDERIATAIETNSMMELSTGLYVDSDKEAGEWNGEKYIAIARNYRPDHLAVLPDMKGACSIEDGAGFLRNESVTIKANLEVLQLVNNAMSHSNIRSLINSWLTEKYSDAWTENVYDTFFVFEDSGKYYKLNYTLEDNTIVISGQTEEVIRVTEYRTKDGTYVGNDKNINVKEQNMNKEQVINKLIESKSNSWIKDDHDTLASLDESVLNKMLTDQDTAAEMAVENAALKSEKKILEDSIKDSESNKEEITDNTDKDVPETTESYIAKAPTEVQGVLNSALAQMKAVQEDLVASILKNERNTFTKEALLAKNIEELKAIAKLSGITEANFAGQAIGNSLPEVSSVSNSDEKPLLPPKVMSS